MNVDVSDSNAFLYHSAMNGFVNGEIIGPQGIDLVVGGKAIRFRLTSEWLIWKYIEITDGGQTLIKIPKSRPSKDQVTSLATLISIYAPSDDRNNFQALEDLKRVSDEVKILERPTGEARILTREMDHRVACSPPDCGFSLVWSASPTRFQVDLAKGGAVRLDFVAPYRSISPRPPDESDGELLITGRPLPGDFAFGLPLGDQEPLRDKVKVIAASDGRLVLTKGSDPPRGAPGPTPYGVKIRSTQEESIIEGRAVDLLFGVSQESFVFARLVGFLTLAGFIFLLAAGVASVRLTVEDVWPVVGLASAIWTILVLRLLFALRFSIEIIHVDGHAVSGVALALVTLTLLPLLMFVIAGHARGKPLARAARFSIGQAMILLGLLTAAGLFLKTGTLWSNLAQEYEPSLSWMQLLLLSGVIGSLLGYMFLGIVRPRHIDLITRKAIELPKRFVGFFQRLWKQLAEKSPAFWVFLVTAMTLVAALVTILLNVAAGIFFGNSGKALTQVLIPLPAYLLLLGFAFGLAGVSRRIVGTGLHGIAAFFVVLLLIVVPFGLADNGNIFAGGAVLTSVGLITAVAGVSTGNINLRGFGTGIAVMLLLAFGTLQLFLKDVLPLSILPRTAQARILAYQKGQDVQHYLLTSEVRRESGDLRFQDLTSSSQHQWENQAMAHEAGLLGFGFGRAPVRQSRIRLDTVQYDSLYSFYVIGDHGLLGGLWLLMLYASPMVILLYGGRRNFDVGYSVSLFVFMLLFFEGVTQAAMNLGLLPLTGRNFPLLAVHSFGGDVLRWSLLIFVAVLALFWRYGRDGAPADGPVLFTFSRPNGQPASTGSRYAQIMSYARPLVRVGALMALPGLLIFLVAIASFQVWRDREFDAPMSLNKLARDVEVLVDNGVVTVTGSPEEPKLTLNEKKFDSSVVLGGLDNKLVGRQVAEFNAMPVAQRLGDPISLISIQDLSSIADRNQYLAFLENIRRRPTARPGRPSRNIFRLRRIETGGDGDGGQQTEPRVAVEFNPDYNFRFSFKEPTEKDDVPTVLFSGDNKKLIGAAWNKGRWVTAYLNEPEGLPWADQLASSLKSEWKNLGSSEALRRYGVLTLDRALHASALRFMDTKGRELHAAQLARTVGSRTPLSKLPARVGLTILKLGTTPESRGGLPTSHGEIAALGGYPRVTPGNRWIGVNDLPPSSLVETLFPIELQRRYLGDRNFDTNLVMGSSTKPLWAASVIALHPNIDTQLRVSGSNTREGTVFGIPIVDANDPARFWSVAPTGWVDLRTYLAKSDNRYQVRLGFLGLAEKTGGPVDLTGAPTSSRNESLAGARPRPIGRTPRFVPQIGFSAENPQAMHHLDSTALAGKLRSMYAAEVASGPESDRYYKGQLVSFWTMSEKDDLSEGFARSNKVEPDPLRGASLLHGIMPARANLGLDRISSPREFVSTLLGGQSNRWSNVQIAAAFATSVSGIPILPHIVKSAQEPEFVAREESFPSISEKLAPGLADVIFRGTATATLTQTGAMQFLTRLREMGYEIYGKTGTLRDETGVVGAGDEVPTSRFVLAIVKFSNRAQGKVSSGLVFSIFGERAGQHAADRWLGEFLVANQADILRLLRETTPTTQAPTRSAPVRRSRRR